MTFFGQLTRYFQNTNPRVHPVLAEGLFSGQLW